MLSKNWFALALLSACGTLKPVPKVDICAGIDEESRQYAYCIPYYANTKPEYEIKATEVFRKGYIMVSPKDFGELKKYVEYLKTEASKRCR